MQISNIPFSSQCISPHPTHLENREACLVILVNELDQLKSAEGLSNHIIIKGNIEIDDTNIYSFALLKSKNVEIEGDLTCRGLSFSKFFEDGINGSQEDTHSFFPKQLIVKGNFTLSEYTDLTLLPEKLEIYGNFKISKCEALTALPSGLKVHGFFNISYCTSLTHLPEELEIPEDFSLSNCPALTALPSTLKVGYSLDLSHCTNLTTLPKELKIPGDLDLSHCTSLTLLPEGLEVQGNIHIRDCTALTAISSGLKVGGYLKLLCCTSLTRLPEGLNVPESLLLLDCKALTAIPSGLKVGENLQLSHCTSLTILSKGLEVQGNLRLDGCTALTTLASELKVGGDLYLSYCTDLTTLSDELKVGGNLYLSGCTNLTTLSEGLEVQGNLDLSHYTALTALPKGLKVGGDLTLSNCTNLTTLSDELKVGGNLYLSGCTNLTTLSEGLEVQGNLDLSRCTALTALPSGLKIGGDLYLAYCTNLTSLPKGLEVQGDLMALISTSLTTLPEGFEVRGNLNLSDCTALTALPKGLKVGGDLTLSYCTDLTTLSEGIEVQGNLNLSRCTALTALPNELKLGRGLNLNRCTNLSSLPNWVGTLGACSNGSTRSIDLTESGLSPAILQRLQAEASNYQGMRFYFSLSAAKGYIVEFKSLLPALEFWQREAKETSMDLEKISNQLHQTLTQVQDHENLRTFLRRLTGTADFYNVATREFLAKRVLKVIQLMAENIEVCHHSAYLIHQGLSSCEDRIAATLSDIGCYHKLKELQRPSITAEELKNSAKGFFLLEQLNKKVHEHIKTLQFVDEIEIYMAFHIRLQKILNLPVDIQGMLFRRCAAISDEKIDQIGRSILETFSETAFASFLTTWDPWNLYQRRLSVIEWEDLPRANKKINSTDICPYLQDIPMRPVLYNHVIYDYDAFITRYLQKGTDLYGKTVQIENLFQMEPSLITSYPLETVKEDHLKRA